MIRAATAADCAAMAAIDAAGNPSPWTAQQFAAALADRYTRACVWQHNAQAAAFIVWQTVCGESELHLIATAPAYRGQGAASALMAHWLAEAAAERCFLEVRASNLAAQNLYRKHGFSECGRRKSYYRLPEGGTEDAVLMEKSC